MVVVVREKEILVLDSLCVCERETKGKDRKVACVHVTCLCVWCLG